MPGNPDIAFVSAGGDVVAPEHVINLVRDARRRLWLHALLTSMAQNLWYLGGIVFVYSAFAYLILPFSTFELLLGVALIIGVYTGYYLVRCFPPLEEAARLLDQAGQHEDIFMTAYVLIRDEVPVTTAVSRVVRDAELAAGKMGELANKFLSSKRPSWPLIPSCILGLAILVTTFPHSNTAFMANESNLDLRRQVALNEDDANFEPDLNFDIGMPFEQQDYPDMEHISSASVAGTQWRQVTDDLSVESKEPDTDAKISLSAVAKKNRRQDMLTSGSSDMPANSIPDSGTNTQPIERFPVPAAGQRPEQSSSDPASSSTKSDPGEETGVQHEIADLDAVLHQVMRRGPELQSQAADTEAVTEEATERALLTHSEPGTPGTTIIAPYHGRFDPSLKQYINRYMEMMGNDS